MNREYLPIFVLSWWYPWFGTSKHRKHVLFMSRILGHNCRTMLHRRLWLGDGRRDMVTTSNGRGCVYTKTTTNNKGKKYNIIITKKHTHTQTTLLFRCNKRAVVKTDGYLALGNYQYCFSCDFKYLKPWTIQHVPLSVTKSTNSTWKLSFFPTGLATGHFRIPKTLTIKMRPSATPFLWKWLLFAWEWRIISISKVEHLTSFWYRGPGDMAYSRT